MTASRRTETSLPDKATLDAFRRKIWSRYHENPRPLPWRETFDPYAILVSEIMLQQTQVDRVAPKYMVFLERFPKVAALAQADLRDVLEAWQGLGYNRRGLALKQAAEQIVERHGGEVPADPADLVALPGIGGYTAAAVAVFAFGVPLVVIETNIRTVFIHEFFPDQEMTVHDRQLAPLVQATVDVENPREWYYALMDYGVALKKTAGNAARRSAHYSRQSPFRGSTREMRSSILREVLAQPGRTIAQVADATGVDRAVAGELVERMAREGLLTVRDALLFI